MFLVITLFAKTHLLPNSKSAITNYLDLWHYYGNTPHLKKSRPPHKFCQIPFLSLPPSVREVSHPCDGRRVLIKTNKTPAFCLKRTSTFFDRKMRPRRRPRFRLTQAACFRVSSSCTLYEVFGNFAWRSAPPRKRVAQSEKAPALRDRECPRP